MSDVIPGTDASRNGPAYRGRVFRPMLKYQIVIDVVVAVVVAGLSLLDVTRGVSGPIGVVTVIGLGAALALRRLSPGLALTVAWVFAIVQMAGWQYPGLPDLGIAAVMYTTSAYGSRTVRTAGLVSAIVGAVTAGTYLGLRSWFDARQYAKADPMDSVRDAAAVLLVVLAILLLPWLAGLLRRTRTSARMSREAQLLAERDAARADRAVAVEQERVRIARDMHDIVAHSLAVVIAQADGARYALKADPSLADEALSTISATSRRALGDVRELLGALRHEQGTAPTPDVDDIDRLVDDMGSLGLRVRLDRSGDPAGMPTTTQLAVYRIVQESLTNAYKHGAVGEPVYLVLSYGADTIGIDVRNRRRDDGRAGPGTGHGLVGMRERATLSGGSMTAGSRGPDFAVSVRMPVTPGSGGMPRGRIVVPTETTPPAPGTAAAAVTPTASETPRPSATDPATRAVTAAGITGTVTPSEHEEHPAR